MNYVPSQENANPSVAPRGNITKRDSESPTNGSGESEPLDAIHKQEEAEGPNGRFPQGKRLNARLNVFDDVFRCVSCDVLLPFVFGNDADVFPFGPFSRFGPNGLYIYDTYPYLRRDNIPPKKESREASRHRRGGGNRYSEAFGFSIYIRKKIPK